MMITYDRSGTLQFDGGLDSKAAYVQALDDRFTLENPFSNLNSGFSILVSQVSAKAENQGFNLEHNHIAFFLTESYDERDAPSVYRNLGWPSEPHIPMVVIAISGANLEDVQNHFNLWTRASNTFFGFETVADLNSEQVLTRLLSDDVDLGDLNARLD